jgi:hypothetical protein
LEDCKYSTYKYELFVYEWMDQSRSENNGNADF